MADINKMENIEKFDKELFDILKAEKKRQEENIELIASENFCSDTVREAVGSLLCHKYTEGYPNNRYYGGCEHYDELETLCQNRWLKVFGVEDTYHCNVQPHSGSQANFAAYAAVLKAGDTVLSMSLENGAHLTHGSPVNFSGKLYDMVFYNVDDNGFIDYEDIKNKVYEYRPKMVVAGASAYSRIIDFKRIKEILEEAKEKISKETGEEYAPYFMVDMAHIAGLVAAGYHPTPFGYADIVTTTTHKTLRNARGGLVFCKKELARKVDSAVFPGSQGGSLMHVIAGKAVGAHECMQPEYKEYIGKVVANTKAMCDEFIAMGYKVVTGGTDNHLFLLDLSDLGITGKDVQEACDRHNITLNKNCVPNDKQKPKFTSGIRIGCAAETTRGKTAEDFKRIAHDIDRIIKQEVMVNS